MTAFLRLAVLVLVSTVLAGCSGAQESEAAAGIYVSANGDDANDGRSRDRPLRTISKAVELVVPGETVLVLPGTYNEQVEVASKGDASDPIIIKGLGGTPVLDGQGQLQYGFHVVDSEGLVFENMELRGYSNEGIGFFTSSDVTARALVVHDNGFDNTNPDADREGFGINVDDCQRVVVEDNEVYANGPGAELRANDVLGTGIDTWGSQDVIIRRNNVHDNIGGGIRVEDSTAVRVSDNTVSSNDADASKWEWWDAGLWIDGGSDVVAADNRFESNLGPGIQVSDEDRQLPKGYVLENNVSTGNYYGIYVWNFGSCPYPPEDVLRLSGNDFAGNSRQDVLCEVLPCPQPCDDEAEDE